ncbi:MAG: hypothetical protein ABJ056_11530 [Halioglobus sp.]
MKVYSLILLACVWLLAHHAQAASEDPASNQAAQGFLLAVIPDTQNMIDYENQRDEGFALDGAMQFQQQMDTLANWQQRTGRALAFVVGVGDVWQHQSKLIDDAHVQRGVGAVENPIFNFPDRVSQRVIDEEIPTAIEGYRKLAAVGIPFGVLPGNHDYDAMWSAAGFPPDLTIPRAELERVPEQLGMIHVGGLDNFRSAFGSGGEFFGGKPWYVSSFAGGSSSAQVFSAAGYRFLHLALEMQPSDAVVAWALGVIDQYPGIPTIVSTHDYLNTDGDRLPNPILDLALADPEGHNSAEDLWRKLISQRDEIFLVLCGHQHGQGRRVDLNVNGYEVHQVLANYQSRGQSTLDAGATRSASSGRPPGVGDGWFRLMDFNLAVEQPYIDVKTYSSHYEAYASELEDYARWYQPQEQPQLSETAYRGRDTFRLALPDFRERFGPPAPLRSSE